MNKLIGIKLLAPHIEKFINDGNGSICSFCKELSFIKKEPSSPVNYYCDRGLLQGSDGLADCSKFVVLDKFGRQCDENE